MKTEENGSPKRVTMEEIQDLTESIDMEELDSMPQKMSEEEEKLVAREEYAKAISQSHQYGDPKNFLSRKEELDFRGVTYLLQLTDQVEALGRRRGTILNNQQSFRRDPPLAEQPVISAGHILSTEQIISRTQNLQVHPAPLPSDEETACKEFMGLLNVLLVRGTESATICRTDKESFVVVFSDPGAVARQNNLEDHVPTLTITSPRGQLKKGQVTVKDFAENLRDLSVNDAKTAEHQRCPFIAQTHCKAIVSMLQAQHHAPNNMKLKTDFRYYVMLASSQKILRRFRMGGQSVGRFGDSGSVTKYLKIPGQGLEFPRGSHDVCLNHLSAGLPTPSQAKFSHMLLKRACVGDETSEGAAFLMGYNHYMGHSADCGTLVEGLPVTDCVCAGPIGHFDASAPMYDQAGRERFQTIMALTYRKAILDLKELEMDIHGSFRANRLLTPELFKTAVKDMEKSVIVAWDSLRTWHSFLEEFGQPGGILDKHLAWLEAIFSKNISPDHGFDEIVGCEIEDDADTVEWIEYAAKGNLGGWARKAKAYMMLTVRHTDAVLRLEPGYCPLPQFHPHTPDDRVSAHESALRSQGIGLGLRNSLITHLQLTVLQASSAPDERDSSMTSINSLLEAALPSNPYCQELIKEWIQETHYPKSLSSLALGEAKIEDLLDTECFTGTWHCETIALALALLSRVTHKELLIKGIKAKESLKKSGDLSLRLPPIEFIRKFRALNSFILGSERRSPVSSIIFDEVMRQISDGSTGYVMRSESHNIWTATALPPWLLREPALLVCTRASAALQGRMNKVMRVQESKRQRRADFQDPSKEAVKVHDSGSDTESDDGFDSPSRGGLQAASSSSFQGASGRDLQEALQSALQAAVQAAPGRMG